MKAGARAATHWLCAFVLTATSVLAHSDEPEEIVVRERSDSLVGSADAASAGTVGAEQLEMRTLSRPGEVLETVPGVIVTQHSGAGKANQFFLRGFNLDHGTDFATSIDGVPVNLPSHGHGQGYTDLNFLIPELVERVDFRKGVYDARDGDFSSAGAADLHYFDALPQGLVLVEGGRFDYYRGVLANSNELGPGHLLPGSSGTENETRFSPKGTLIFGPWLDTELHLSAGRGLHSNDARGVTDPVDPADPLVRTDGAEVGVRTTLIPGLHSSVALWWLDLDSELLFVGDAGTTEATRESRRIGIEIANYYEFSSWLTFDGDVSLSHARFRDSDPAGDHVPGAVETVVAAGASLPDLGGPFGAIRLRYFGPRPLTEDGVVESNSTVLLSARVGYEFASRWTIAAEIYNLLDRDDHEIDYSYPSRLPGEGAGPDEGGFDDVHFHPTDPISFRIALSAKF